MERDGLGEKVIQLQSYLGLAWILGCVTFGMLVVNRECIFTMVHYHDSELKASFVS